MPRVNFNFSDSEHLELKNKAASLGLTIPGYIKQVLKDTQQIKSRSDTKAVTMAMRRLIPILVIAMGKTQNQNQQAIDKLTQLLLKEYDQGSL